MTTSGKNYYEILGIATSAGRDEIRAVYRRLAFIYHPDRNSDPQSQLIFQEIIEAFSVLSDPEKRAEYDAILFDDQPLISTVLDGTVAGASEMYREVADKTGARRQPSEREEYLRHLEKNRRRRALGQTALAIILILLLFFFGFKPLQNSSKAIAPTTETSTTTSKPSKGNSNSSGNSLNQNLIVIEGPAGIDGIPGPAGRDGRIGVDGIPGATGPAGAPGPAGAAGAAGKDGAAGPAGPAGSAGAPGAAGPAGPAGAAGAQGAAGRDGQDASVYSVKPNLGALGGFIGPCNQDLSDTSTAPGLDVTVTPLFDPTDQNYKLKSFNFKGFTSACRGAQLGINVILASNASANANATFQCAKTLSNTVTSTDIVKFEAGSNECTKFSGTWGSSGVIDIGTIVASDLARINLIVTG
jgi:hypothetical protein